MKNKFLKLSVVSCLLVIGAIGCSSKSPIKPTGGHIVNAAIGFTKGGVSENPITGLYELGLLRGRVDVSFVPCTLVSNETGIHYVTPDTVFRDEIQGKNTILGAAGSTTTFATGSNAVGTAVGGMTPPINSNGTIDSPKNNGSPLTPVIQTTTTTTNVIVPPKATDPVVPPAIPDPR